jgi:TonB family protein
MNNRKKIIVMVCWLGFFWGTAFFISAEQTAFALQKEGKKAIYEKDWDRAVQLFQKLESGFPGSKLRGEALYWLAYSLEKQDRQIKALHYLNRLIETYRGDEWVDDARILRVQIAADLTWKGFSNYYRYVIEAAQAGDDGQLDVKMAGLDALMRLDPQKALPLLEKLYRENEDPDVRDSVIFILRHFNESKVIAALSGSQQRKEAIIIGDLKYAYTYPPLKRAVPPPLVKRVEPAYPKEALEQGIAGKVILKVAIGKKGGVLQAVAVKGAHPLLAGAAEKALKQWKFLPYTKKGRRLEVYGIVTLDFSLEQNQKK